jgi:hypothetical protein
MIKRHFLTIFLLACLGLAGCEKDYKVFDTVPAFVVGKPKIRFLNLHFFKTRLTVNISNGRLVKENLVHRALTAYEELPDDLRGIVPYTVTDSAGAEVLRDTLRLQEGSNFTLVIFPAYDGKLSDYQSPPPSPSLVRYMITLRSDRVNAALVGDPLSPPFQDRSAVRLVTLSPDMVVNPAGATRFTLLPAQSNAFQNQFLEVNGTVVVPALPRLPTPATPGIAFRSFVYGVAEPGDYIATWSNLAGITSVFNPDADGQVSGGKTLRLVDFQPYTLQPGKSYTVITNGTVGESNDVTFPSDVRSPLPLKPIPYEAFILEDGDGTARNLVPVALERQSRQTAVVGFVNLNYSWQAANPFTELRLANQGTLMESGRLSNRNSHGFLSFFSTPYTLAETRQFGDRLLSVAVDGFSRPTLAETRVNLAPNGKYLAFHYLDRDNTARLKVFPADTVVRYGQAIRINFANFSPDLEPVAVADARTRRVLVSRLAFAELSQTVDLPLDRSFVGAPGGNGSFVVEKMNKIAIIRPATGETLFEIDLTPVDIFTSQTNRLLGGLGGQQNSGIVLTVIFSGRYNPGGSPAEKFEKRILALERADRPTNSGEEVFDWRMVYGLLP